MRRKCGIQKELCRRVDSERTLADADRSTLNLELIKDVR